MSTLQQFAPGAWAEISGEGISTIYFSIIDEGMITSPTDTPANTQYRPRIKSPETFSIKRAPAVWPRAATSGTQGAAYGQLVIDNYDGAFDFLIAADLRDTPVVLKSVPAGALLTGTTVASAPVIATALIDVCSSTNEDEITVALKDTIARLDKALPARFNPPFVDANAAGKMVPMSFGPFRNRQPLLQDTPNRLFEVHDAPLTTVTRVTDMAAPLDPAATPPQYTLALNNSGLQLNAMPVGLLTCEGSVVGGVGTGAVVPSGSNDVLLGSGAFPGTQGAATLAAAWLGQYGWGTATNASATIGATTAVTFPTLSAAPTAGDQVYATDGTNKLLGTVAASPAPTTTSATITKQDSVGTTLASGATIWKAGAPTGWKFTASPTSSPVATVSEQVVSLVGGPVNVATMFSNGVWYNGGGSVLSYETAVLQPGSTYRLSFGLYNVQYCGIIDAGGWPGGFVVSTASPSAIQADYIAGYFNPLSSGGAFAGANYVFEFTVPPGASPRKLYFAVLPTEDGLPGSATVKNNFIGGLYNVRCELLGQYVAAPLNPISMTDYFTEILVNRAGELPAIFNATDTAALAVHPLSNADTNRGGTGTPADLVGFSCCFDAPPNILDALRLALDNFCACIFTDNNGVLRARRLTDPSDPTGRVVKADFIAGLANYANVARPLIAIDVDPAAYLTTLFGARRNWKVFSPADFVTDQAVVTQNTRAMFSRTSQYLIRAMQSPASNYSFAVGAAQFDTTIDVPADCQLEADRVVGVWSPNVYADGTSVTGKRRVVQFTAYYDDPAAVGATIQTAVTNLMFGDIVTLTYAEHGFKNTPAAILEWEIFPFANQLNLTVLI